VAREITARQRAVYRFIVETVTQRGYPPTVREIGEHFDMRSTGSVRDHLSALERKGFIRRAANTSRGIELVNLQDRPGANTMAVPLLGQIAAGAPLLAVENQEDTLNVDARLFGRNGTVFALRVKGDSMRDAGILDGDVVFVRQQADAEDGQIVAARINDEATVKRYYREKDHVRLQPANDAYEPIIVTPQRGEVAVLGKVVGLTRSY
jgi:repressor LexA